MKFGKYFCGNEISRYGRENGYVDYATLAKSFQHVLCNDVFQIGEYEDWELFNGSDYCDDEDFKEFFQYYIISEQGAEILRDYTNETVWYNEQFSMYVWGVTHYGTSWDYVLTDIECDEKLEDVEE